MTGSLPDLHHGAARQALAKNLGLPDPTPLRRWTEGAR